MDLDAGLDVVQDFFMAHGQSGMFVLPPDLGFDHIENLFVAVALVPDTIGVSALTEAGSAPANAQIGFNAKCFLQKCLTSVSDDAIR